MLGIPFFAVWILEVVLFALAVGIGIWSIDSDIPWWAALGLVGALILLALLGWGIFKAGRKNKLQL
jgi:hypothetical protein